MMDWIWRLLLAAVLIYIVFKRADLCAGIAQVMYGRGHYNKAVKLFDIADKIGNLSSSNKAQLGYYHLRRGELAAARHHLVEASFSSKNKPAMKNSIKSMLALVTWKEGDLDTAIEMMEEIPVEQYNSIMYQNLGLLYILHGDKEKALEFNLKGHDYNEDDKVIMDNLAEAYALNGDYDKAAETYEKLLEKEPHFPEAYYGYGFLLIKMNGDRERALELIKISLDKRYSFLSLMQKDEVEQKYLELAKQ